MIRLADTWSKAEDRSLLETGLRRATGQLRLGDVMPKPMIQYQNDPVGFFIDILEVPERTIRWSVNPGYADHEWDGTVDPLIEALEALARSENVVIEAGTGTQKSWMLAGVYAWFLASWQDSRVFTFAPKAEQLRLYSWMEFRKWHWTKFKRHFQLAELTDLKLRMIPGSDQWGMWGYPVQLKAGEEISSHAKGQHTPHQLLVYEEMQAIAWPVIEAGKNTATAPHNPRMGVGNPSHQQDSLHRMALERRSSAIRISSLDHPNVVCDDPEIVPGAVSRQSVEERREEYGEDNPLYKAQVRGLSPAESTQAFIKAEWCAAAIARAKNPELRERLIADGYFPALGFDVANVKGGDNAAIARGRGALCTEVEEIRIGVDHRVKNASHLGVLIAVEMGTDGIDQRHVGGDPVGVGASTFNKLKEFGLNVQELHGSGAVQIDEDLLREQGRSYVMAGAFGNARAQKWFQGQIDLQHGKVGLPDDPELVRDLVSVEWILKNGKLWAEPKENVIERLGRSPNKGDAWIDWNWIRPRRTGPPVEEAPLRAFDPEVLEHEAREGRRVRPPKPAIPAGITPDIVERIA